MTTTTEHVLVRTYRGKAAHDAEGGFACIVWPLEPATMHAGEQVTCWHYIGQHGGACLRYIMAATRPATPEEAAEAIAQWRSEGPDRSPQDVALVVRQRAPSWSRILAAHRAALAPMQATTGA